MQNRHHKHIVCVHLAIPYVYPSVPASQKQESRWYLGGTTTPGKFNIAEAQVNGPRLRARKKPDQ